MGAVPSAHKSDLNRKSKEILQRKILAIGDGTVGKTCALISFTSGTFPHDLAYVPTVFENYSSLLCVDGTVFKLDLWDTAGQEDYDSTRRLSYARTDIFMIMFAINSRDSFRNVEDKWVPDLSAAKEAIEVPLQFVLIGTKTDLRSVTKKEQQVSKEEAEALAQKLGALFYMEFSAMTQEEAFQRTCRETLPKSKHTQKK